jgi:hypothetical protein
MVTVLCIIGYLVTGFILMIGVDETAKLVKRLVSGKTDTEPVNLRKSS